MTKGETRFDQLFSGITVERPTNFDPQDLTGTEGITVHDTAYHGWSAGRVRVKQCGIGHADVTTTP